MDNLTKEKAKSLENYLMHIQDGTINLYGTSNTVKDLTMELRKYSNYKLTPKYLGMIYLLVNPPDKDGFSPEITIAELTKYHPSFRTSNGGDWCRSDSSYLGKKYNIRRIKKGGSIYSVKLDGKNKGKKINQSIKSEIVYQISKMRCSILDVGKVEVDHKNGKKDESYMNDIDKQKLEDFQALSKAANDAKREHCKKCRETGLRFDAQRLGYKESFTKGDYYTDNCQGCYWYDPKAFNAEISSNFSKKV